MRCCPCGAAIVEVDEAEEAELDSEGEVPVETGDEPLRAGALAERVLLSRGDAMGIGVEADFKVAGGDLSSGGGDREGGGGRTTVGREEEG